VPLGTVLPYSANGIAFSRDGAALYIANMSTNTIYKQKVKRCENPFTGCEPDGAIAVFSNDSRIDGPDNMDFDNEGHLFVASGQNQHVIELDKRGDVVGVYGSFRGFDSEGAPKGLLQPSGIIYSKGKIYIGNESSQSLLPASDNIDWSKLKLFTISSIDLDCEHHDDREDRH
jgi:DNA-binding beta-propeller fold protein YncE